MYVTRPGIHDPNERHAMEPFVLAPSDVDVLQVSQLRKNYLGVHSYTPFFELVPEPPESYQRKFASTRDLAWSNESWLRYDRSYRHTFG